MRAFDDATFNVGIPKHLKLDALAFQHLLELSIENSLPLCVRTWTGRLWRRRRLQSLNIDVNTDATALPVFDL